MADNDTHVIGLTIKGKNEATQPGTIDMGLQRRLLAEHGRDWMLLGDVQKKTHEDHQKQTHRTAEAYKEFGKTVLDLGKQLGIVFTVAEIADFTRKAILAGADADRAASNARAMAGLSVQQAQHARDQLELLERETGKPLEGLLQQYGRFGANVRMEGEKGLQIFSGAVEASTLFGVKVDDMAVAVASTLYNIKKNVNETTDSINLGNILPAMEGVFVQHLPKWERLLKSHGLNSKQMLAELSAMHKAAAPAFGGDQQASANFIDELLSKGLSNPKYSTVIEEMQKEGKGVRDFVDFLIKDLDKQQYPREFLARLYTADYIAGIDAIRENLQNIPKWTEESAAASAHTHDTFLERIKDVRGGIDALTGSFLQFERAVGTVVGTTKYDIIGAITNRFLADTEVLKGKAPITTLHDFFALPGSGGGQPGRTLPGGKPLPHFQTGGVVNKPTVATVGEAGPEAIIPLADIKKAAFEQEQKDKEEAATTGRLHELALMGKPRPRFRDWDDIVSGALKHMGGGGGGGGGGGSSGGGGASGTVGSGQPSTTGGDDKTVTGSGQLEGPAKGEFGKGGNLSAAQLVKSGVDPLLVESIQQGANRAFGDPNDPSTRYVVQMQGGTRSDPGSFHHTGKAIDLQIYDRQSGQFIGGKGDIMKNAFGNPTTYRTYEILAQARYQWALEKYGKATADRMSWGGRFGKSRQGAGPDEMHFSLGEGGRLGHITEAAHGPYAGPTGSVKGWLAGAGAAPSEGMGDDPSKWKSPLRKMAEGGVVTSPTMALIGESGPEAVMPLRSGQAYADRDAVALRALAYHNEALLRPGVRGTSSVARALRAYERGSSSEMGPGPQAGTPEGQILPGGTNLFGGSEFKELKSSEYLMEHRTEKQLQYGRDIEQGNLGHYQSGPIGGGWRKEMGGWEAGYVGSSGGAGASSGWASADDAKRAAGVRSELTDVIKQAQQDNPDLPFVVGPGGGTRTQAQQDEMVRKGVSWTRQSMHLGGNAIDVVPLINGKMDWDSQAAQAAYSKIETAIYSAANKQHVLMGPEAMDPAFHKKDPGHYSIPPGARPEGIPKETQRFSPGPPQVEPKVTSQAMTDAKPARGQPTLSPQVRRNTRRQVARQYNNFHGNAEAQHKRTTFHGNAGHV